MRLQRILLSLGWRLFMLGYFGVGLGALTLLFLIEAEFFIQITRHPALGYAIAGIFEAAKIGTSIIRQVIVIANRVYKMKVSALIQGVTILSQVALVAVSLICSIVVVTSYLDGSAFEAEARSAQLSEQADDRIAAVSLVTSSLAILKNGWYIELNPATVTSLFALVLSALFQGTVYIVFGHILATQSHEIEHIFEIKLLRLSTKKKLRTEHMRIEARKQHVETAKQEVLDEVDRFTDEAFEQMNNL